MLQHIRTNGTNNHASECAHRSTTQFVANECAASTTYKGRTQTTLTFSWFARCIMLTILLSLVALLDVVMTL